MRDKKIIDADFEVIEGPEADPGPVPFWRRFSWSPWPAIGALALGLPALLKVLLHP
jgi:hypothetical protein